MSEQWMEKIHRANRERVSKMDLDPRPSFWYVTVDGKVESHNPMCDRCLDVVREKHEGQHIVWYPADQMGGQCIHCGTDYEDEKEQRRYAEYLDLKRLYRDADRAAERG